MGMETPTTSGFATEGDYNKLEHFRRHFIGPPSGLYVTVDDIILFRGWAAVAGGSVQVTLRMLAPNGEIVTVFQVVNVLVNGATATTFLLRNLEGFILSATAALPSVQRGQVFCSLMLQRGAGTGDASLGQVLFQGYPDTFDTLGYPQSVPGSSLDGRGAILLTAVGAPAAGVDWSYTVPFGAHQVIRSVTALFTASAAAANRFPVLVIDDGAGDIVAELPVTSVIIANQGMQLTWAPGLNPLNVNNVQTMGLNGEMRIRAGWRIRTLTAGIQAADQWSAIVVVVESFGSQ